MALGKYQWFSLFLHREFLALLAESDVVVSSQMVNIKQSISS